MYNESWIVSLKQCKFYLVLESCIIGLLFIGFQETGWTPCHIVAKDESENILCVVPLYLKRFSPNSLFIYLFSTEPLFFILHFLWLTVEKIYCFPSVAAFPTCNLIFNLQSFLRRICFWSFLGWCLLQYWCKILPKTTILRAFYSSDWAKDFNP